MEWVCLWLAVLVVEFLAYVSLTTRWMQQKWLRWSLFGLIGLAAVILTVGILAHDHSLWLMPVVFVPYQLINLARAAAFRRNPKHLKNLSIYTLGWLVFGQLVALGAAMGFRLLQPEVGIKTLVIIQTLITLGLFLSTRRTWMRIKRSPLRQPMTDRELPSLSVLIPARNETKDLRECLESIIASDYPKLEIIALDDNSEDKRTPEIIRSFARDGVRFIAGKQPDDSWLAKNAAYNQLRRAASGEILIFCGVDVRVNTDTLRHLVEVMIAENRQMISILPMRPVNERRRLSFIQAMRYWWELAWPRRIFNRPPVLSTLWAIRADALDGNGGFAAAKKMITPEAYFAKALVKTDGYIFVRSTPSLPIYSHKSIDEQYSTVIRIRYPQLHRRVSIVAFVSIFEFFVLITPFIVTPISLIASGFSLVTVLLTINIILISYMYYLIGIKTRLNNLYLGILTAPVSFVLDIVGMHLSMWRYEFGEVIWHERNVSATMLEVIPSLPKLPDETKS